MIEEDEWSKELEANRKPGQKHPTPSPVRRRLVVNHARVAAPAPSAPCCYIFYSNIIIIIIILFGAGLRGPRVLRESAAAAPRQLHGAEMVPRVRRPQVGGGRGALQEAGRVHCT